MIDIRMAGIDHERASVEQRETLAFTKHQAAAAVKQWTEMYRLFGCLLLSTCNRTELWISGSAGVDAFSLICESKGVEPKQYRELEIHRQGEEAVEHLMLMTCGLKSRIRGEDQILSQVREALETARTCGCTDRVIEKVFQMAIAAGKKVKTKVRLQKAEPSAAGNAVLLLKEKLGELKDVPCLIIGNGQMGKLTANKLTAAGAHVTMTLRKKMHGNSPQESVIPAGCRMIQYEDRFKELESYKAVISATLSPHFTITADVVSDMRPEGIWIDMAVPRDIEPAAGKLPGVTLYDMDDLGGPERETGCSESVIEAEQILESYKKELERWFAFRRYAESIRKLAEKTAEDACKRIGKSLIEKEGANTQGAVCRAVEKLLFGLRDTLPEESWEDCFAALESSALRDTLKTGERKKR